MAAAAVGIAAATVGTAIAVVGSSAADVDNAAAAVKCCHVTYRIQDVDPFAIICKFSIY